MRSSLTDILLLYISSVINSMSMKSLFDSKVHDNILKRIECLDNNSPALWGKMSVDQMLKHCQLTLEIANGKREMKGSANGFKKIIFSLFKPMMYNDKPWRHNLKTAKELIITNHYNFTTEKDYLIELINEFVSKKDNTNWPEHPLFGHFTTDQRGKMQYKHLDHHLKQFDV